MIEQEIEENRKFLLDFLDDIEHDIRAKLSHAEFEGIEPTEIHDILDELVHAVFCKYH